MLPSSMKNFWFWNVGSTKCLCDKMHVWRNVCVTKYLCDEISCDKLSTNWRKALGRIVCVTKYFVNNCVRDEISADQMPNDWLYDEFIGDNLSVWQIVYVTNFCVTYCLVTNSLWRTVLSRSVDVKNCLVTNCLSDKMSKDEMSLKRLWTKWPPTDHHTAPNFWFGWLF